MPVSEQAAGEHLVLLPQEPLQAAAAGEFERRIQDLFQKGHRHLVIDLRHTASLDSAGIRALIRGHTTAKRLAGTFRLTGANSRVQELLNLSRLDSVLGVYESVEAAKRQPWPWRTFGFYVAGGALCAVMVILGLSVPSLSPSNGTASVTDLLGGASSGPHMNPFVELLKLATAAFIGILVTAVHQRSRRDKPLGHSMEQAQVLLCVSGAMMMIIIGNSLARAFGIAGAASIIRFRTPVDDPKDVTILFLLMGLGMSVGVGAFAVAGLGTLFLCICLLFLDSIVARKPRTMMVTLSADGREFPTTHVERVFARHEVLFEPREVSQGDEAIVKYHVTLSPEASLESLSSQLMAHGSAGIKAVSWEAAKKSA